MLKLKVKQALIKKELRILLSCRSLKLQGGGDLAGA